MQNDQYNYCSPHSLSAASSACISYIIDTAMLTQTKYKETTVAFGDAGFKSRQLQHGRCKCIVDLDDLLQWVKWSEPS